MHSQPYYKVEEFWFGLAIGLTMIVVSVAVLWFRAWALRRIRFKLAQRVSRNFVVAGEIFRLIRLPHGSELTPEVVERLNAGIEEHSQFFADLLEDKQSFCLFFGNVFAWAFDDIGQIYRDFVQACGQLGHLLSSSETAGSSLQAEMDRHLRIVVIGADLMNDLTYFRLSRAVAIVDSACRPILDEASRKARAQAAESKFPALAEALTRPA